MMRQALEQLPRLLTYRAMLLISILFVFNGIILRTVVLPRRTVCRGLLHPGHAPPWLAEPATPDDPVTQVIFPVPGYYDPSPDPSQPVQAWWRCYGGFYLMDFINVLRQDFSPPFGIGQNRPRFYANSAYKLYHSQHAADKRARVTRVEYWADIGSGLNGFVHLEVSGPGGRVNNTVYEFSDDTATGPKFWPSTAKQDRIYLIVTAFQRPQSLRRFLKAVRRLVEAGENLAMCICVYTGDEDAERQLEPIRSVMTTTVLKKEPPFRKAPNLQECLGHLQPDDIAFLVDVDTTFTSTVTNNLRRYVAKGKRVWAPIVWYNEVDEEGRHYDRNPTGFAKYGTGIVALYKSDSDKVGGFDSVFQDQYGFEDTDFFFRIRYHKFQIVRYAERELEHWPHDRSTWQVTARLTIEDLCPGFNLDAPSY